MELEDKLETPEGTGLVVNLLLNRLDKIEDMIDKMVSDFKNPPRRPYCSFCNNTGQIKFETGLGSEIRACSDCSIAKWP